jgi:protein SCO1/2
MVPTRAARERARWRRWALRLATVVIAAASALALAGCGGSGSQASSTGSEGIAGGSPVPPGLATPPAFRLHDQSGRAVSLSGERGHPVVVTFLYVHCPDVCPLIAEHLAAGLRELPPAVRSRARVLAVSVDPKGDTPAAVRHFISVHRLPPQFRYLTGSAAELRPIWAAYHVAAVPDADDETIDHSAYELFIDPSGTGRVIFGSDITARQTADALSQIGG